MASLPKLSMAKLPKKDSTTDTPPRHGNQGTLDSAAKGTLEAEFGSAKEEDAITQILEKGNIIESEV
jgi:hypothetical protein